jgi:two-component system CitB family response regulator
MTPIRTLIVDDDFAVGRLHGSFLAEVPGFELAGSELTATAALGRIRQGGIDLLLLDLYLPDLSGVDLLRRIRSDAGLDVDVIMVSAAFEAELVEQAVSLGVIDFLRKPFTHDAFTSRLQSYATWAQHRRRMRDFGQLSQAQIDLLLARGAQATSPSVPKGLSAATRERVISVLEEASAAVTAGELAEQTGLSRVSARRYLELLVHEGLVEMRPRYGEAGRPQHEYRWGAGS